MQGVKLNANLLPLRSAVKGVRKAITKASFKWKP